MIASNPAAALALPVLSDEIPFAYCVEGDSGICAPLALALLETPGISNKMFSLGPNALLTDVFQDLHERDLAERALTNWWDSLQTRYPTKIFQWDLVISDANGLPSTPHYSKKSEYVAVHAWFCLRLSAGRFNMPRFSLAHATEKLEGRLEGFGQTVLAVLHDALAHLPDAFTPWQAADLAEMLYWSEAETDAELVALARLNGDDPADLVTRDLYFRGMPRWIASPERQCTREEIVRAAREGWEQQIVTACDAIAGLVSTPDFDINSYKCGTSHASIDSIAGMAVLVWRPMGPDGDALDHWLNDLGNTGEYVDFIDMHYVPMTSQGIAAWMRRATQMQQLARLTERLITLIGEPF